MQFFIPNLIEYRAPNDQIFLVHPLSIATINEAANVQGITYTESFCVLTTNDGHEHYVRGNIVDVWMAYERAVGIRNNDNKLIDADGNVIE